MSVINSVLRDLENRQSRFTPIDIAAGRPALRTRRDPRPFIGIGLALLLGTAGAWAYFLHGDANNPAVAPSTAPPLAAAAFTADPAPPAAPPPVAAQAEAATVSANQIVGLQLRETDAELELEFTLRDRVVGYLRERADTRFTYHLRNIESRIVAPVMRDNPWVRELDLVALEDGIDIRFETTPDVLVETRQHLIDGEPVWAISLRRAAPPAAAATAPIAARAGPAIPAAAPAAAVAADDAAAGQTAAADAPAPPAEETTTASAPVVKVDIRTTDPAARSRNQLDYATDLVNSGRLADAESLLQGLFGGAEDYAARRHLLALYERQRQRDRALALVRDSIERYPEDAEFVTEHARLLFQRADYRGAIALLEAQLSLDAGREGLLAASYQRLDRHAEAVRHYRLALAQDAADAKNWIGLGISQEHTANLADALDSYQRAGRIGTLSARLQAFVEKRSDTLRQVLN